MKKLELDDSLWLVSKEKEIGIELNNLLDKPPSIKKLPPLVSKSQQLYLRQQKNKHPAIDRKKNRESLQTVPIKQQNRAILGRHEVKKTVENKVLPTEIEANNKDFMSPQPNNNNKHDETAEVLRLFNSPHSIKSLESKKKIEQEAILPENISNISIFSQKEKGAPMFNSKASFTKVKGIGGKEEPGKSVAIFNYERK